MTDSFSLTVATGVEGVSATCVRESLFPYSTFTGGFGRGGTYGATCATAASEPVPTVFSPTVVTEEADGGFKGGVLTAFHKKLRAIHKTSSAAPPARLRPTTIMIHCSSA